MKKILVCTDGSAHSATCCRYACFFAQLLGASIEAVYVSDLRQFEMPLVADFSGSIGVQPYRDLLDQLHEIEKQKATLLRKAIIGICQNVNYKEKFHFHHRTGLMVDCLDSFERGKGSVDLVMLGKRGENVESAVEHLGSTMERVVRASIKPCFVTPSEYTPIQRLLIAYDGGPSCKKALQWLILNKQAIQQLELHLISSTRLEKEDKATQALQLAEQELRDAGFELNCQMLTGIVEDTVGNYVESHNIHMIIMGAYGHSRIRHLFIGSSTTELLLRCDVPIMLFR